jgi:hypothetical protein
VLASDKLHQKEYFQLCKNCCGWTDWLIDWYFEEKSVPWDRIHTESAGRQAGGSAGFQSLCDRNQKGGGNGEIWNISRFFQIHSKQPTK